jgi:hypothetical protein
MSEEFLGDASESYSDRQKHINIAEELFTEWALKKEYKISRVGFDEKNGYVDCFKYLNIVLRNLPDFIIERDKCFVVNVKGTGNIKKTEYELIPKLIDCFSTEKAPLIYAFCFRNKEPIFKFANEVISLYEEKEDRVWSDGVIYRNINLKV